MGTLRLLTPNQKEQKADSCKELIELELKHTRFYDRIVTMDETWVHHFDPEMKSSSMQWKTSSSPTPKKARVEPSCGKVMLSCFWNRDGIIITDYLEQGHTITGNYYCIQLCWQNCDLLWPRKGMGSCKKEFFCFMTMLQPTDQRWQFTHRCSVVSKFSLIRRIHQI